MEVDRDPAATTKQNTAEATFSDQIQYLIVSAIREGFERISQENVECQARTRKELLEALDRARKEDMEQIRKEGEKTREMISKALECFATQSGSTTTYASAVRGNMPVQLRQANGGTVSSGSVLTRAALPVANPRAETDIRVWIKSEVARGRLAHTTSGEMVKTINTWLEAEGADGRATAARQVKNGNVVVATEDRENKQDLLRNAGWLQTLDVEAEIATPTHMVLLHGVRVKAVNMDKPEQTIEELRANNTQLLENTKIKKISWSKTPLPAGKEYTSIVIGFESPAAANRAIVKGMVMEHKIHSCELFDVNCRRKQCFRCQKYGHISVGCRNPVTCNYCSGHHLSSACESRGKKEPPRCAACGEKGHPAWDKNCNQSKAEDQRIAIARSTRPLLYNEEDEKQGKERQKSTEGQEESTQEKSNQLNEYIFSQPKRGRGRPKSPTKQPTQDTKLPGPHSTPTPDMEKAMTHYISSQGRSCAPSAKAQQSGWVIAKIERERAHTRQRRKDAHWERSIPTREKLFNNTQAPHQQKKKRNYDRHIRHHLHTAIQRYEIKGPGHDQLHGR